MGDVDLEKRRVSKFRYIDSDTVQHFGDTDVLNHSCFTSDYRSRYDVIILQAWRLQVDKYTMWPPEHSEKGRKLERIRMFAPGLPMHHAYNMPAKDRST